MSLPNVFFGYAGQPRMRAETMQNAADLITTNGCAKAVTWQSMAVSGRVIIARVLDAIDAADLGVFEISNLNENVLFEAGYAIGRGKPVWFLLDATAQEARVNWEKFQLLASVGYVSYRNSEDVLSEFLGKDPVRDTGSLYDDVIEPNLVSRDSDGQQLLYLPTYQPFEASNSASRRVDKERRRGVAVFSADPKESGVEPLQWYAQRIYEADAVLVHFAASSRNMASVHNPRWAFLAGLAKAFECEILMLAEEDYSGPLDYRDMLSHYESAKKCESYTDEWLKRLQLRAPTHGSRAFHSVGTELRGLRFGEHVAENEVDSLGEYFLPTSAYDDVLRSRDTLFVGRRGTGKTANALQAFEELSEDTRNLAVMIKPAGYEFSGLLAVLGSLPNELKAYFIDSLWRFLIQSELASVILAKIEDRPSGIPITQAEGDLIRYADESRFGIREDFAVRLERTVDALSERLDLPPGGVADGRNLINEAMHSTALRELRRILGPVLRGKERVAVLVDNLDKAWDRHSDLPALSQLLLGLLAAVGRTVTDFSREDYWKDKISLTVAVFLRSDIFAYVQYEAREPDKLPVARLTWRDPDMLLSIIESRFIAARGNSTSADQLWSKYVTESIDDIPARDFIASQVLPRPRDIIHFCNAAVITAADRRHSRIEENDLREALKIYSAFAFEALLVENGITIPELEGVLYEFVGSPVIQTEGAALSKILASGLDDDKSLKTLERLKDISFLGQEVSRGVFEYPERGGESRRVEAFARNLEPSKDRRRLKIHPAFHVHLGIQV